MMIAVIGQHEPASQLDTMPWEVDRLENGSLRVFGLTLGKTSIQEANQIFARFGKSQFRVSTDINGNQSFEMFTLYTDLTFSGLLASIKLNYQIDQKSLESIYRSMQAPGVTHPVETIQISNDIEMKYLSATIASITYIPSVDYELQTIRQYFGQASEEKSISDEYQLWSYPEMGLQIHIHSTEPDQFVYAQLQ